MEPITSQEIRAIRKALGLSQEGLARHIGVSTSAVVRWEQGNRQPSHFVAYWLRRLGAGKPLPKVDLSR